MKINLPVNEHDFSEQVPAFENFLDKNGYLTVYKDVQSRAPSKVYVLGGIIRDFFISTANNVEIPINDLDLVLDDASKTVTEEDMQKALSSIGQLERNRYNSYKLDLPNGKSVDIIPFTQSKYSKEHNEAPSIGTRLKTAFFGLESVAWDLESGKLFEIGFFKDLTLRRFSVLNDQYGQYHTHYVRSTLYEKKFKQFGFSIHSSVVDFLKKKYVVNPSEPNVESTEKLITDYLKSKGKEQETEYVFNRLKELEVVAKN
ncbi:hypothetical protein HY837_00860 [archaeon]|nr:hypothetical protein [archaeon]